MLVTYLCTISSFAIYLFLESIARTINYNIKYYDLGRFNYDFGKSNPTYYSIV